MRWLDTTEAGFDAEIARLTAWDEELDSAVNETVTQVLRDVSTRGDAAVLEYTARFDRLDVASMAELEVSAERLLAARQAIEPEQCAALEQAAERIRSYHEHQVQDSWQYRDDAGNLLGQKITPMQRVQRSTYGRSAGTYRTLLYRLCEDQLQ